MCRESEQSIDTHYAGVCVCVCVSVSVCVTELSAGKVLI